MDAPNIFSSRFSHQLFKTIVSMLQDKTVQENMKREVEGIERPYDLQTFNVNIFSIIRYTEDTTENNRGSDTQSATKNLMKYQ